ncbi:MAG: hypothetical protein GY856_27960 [bacterium]|nr:hypothetical protein [bacterium]
MKTPTRALNELSQHREQVEERLTALHNALESELGWAPKAKAWVIPLMAFACGVALAFALRERKRTSETEE